MSGIGQWASATELNHTIPLDRGRGKKGQARRGRKDSSRQGGRRRQWEKLELRPHPDGGGVGTWDYTSVREASDARGEARRGDFTVHFGSIAELCFEKGSELPEGDPQRKFKGRHVFLGDQVKDQDFQNAGFEQLGSSLPTFEVRPSGGCLIPSRRLRKDDSGRDVRLHPDLYGWREGGRHPNLGSHSATSMAQLLGGGI